jgi:hypothetical protein
MALALLPSDAVNLADDQVACPACAAAADLLGYCNTCDGDGTVVADTGREALSHTRLRSFLACSRKYELSYRERLERVDTPAALELGRAFAHALQHADPAAGAAFLRDHATINNQTDEDRVRIQAATVASGARYYLDRYGVRPGEQRELTYRIRLRSPWTGAYSRTFDLTGRADGVIDCGSHLELIEDKFVGQVTEASVKKLKMDRQISLTCYGLYRATGKFVRVVHYRQTRKPSIKQKQGRNGVGAETVEQFVERLAADYADPGRGDFYGNEESLFRSEDDLVRVEGELWTWAEQLRQAARQQLYDRNTDACLEHGGCAFMPICAGDPDALTLYRRRPDRSAAPTIATEEAAA